MEDICDWCLKSVKEIEQDGIFDNVRLSYYGDDLVCNECKAKENYDKG